MGCYLNIIETHYKGVLTAPPPPGPARFLTSAGCFIFLPTILKYRKILFVRKDGKDPVTWGTQYSSYLLYSITSTALTT